MDKLILYVEKLSQDKLGRLFFLNRTLFIK